jgi:hypothetical protein
MINIELKQLPNQSTSITLNGNIYDITIRSTTNSTTATIARNGSVLVSNIRILPLYPILPYRYLENGNFCLITDADDLPDYTLFGVSQSLVYLTPDELTELRNA